MCYNYLMRDAIRLARGANLWLEHELVLASETVNSLYSDYDRVVSGYRYAADDARNISAQKATSHANRFMNNGTWFASYEAHPSDDSAAGKMVFACLMRLSGARKNVGYTHSSDQESFIEYLNNPDNYSASRLIIAQELASSPSPITFDRIREINNRTIDVHNRTFDHYGLDANGKFTTESGYAARFFEADTLRTLTNYALLCAEQRGGDLQQVPALEPMSISLNPAVIYPFSDEVLDAGYQAA
jgi:hypothetical protein